MYKYFLLTILLAGASVQAKRGIKCVCNDKAEVMPDCGICGVTAGTMDKTDTGVRCMCDNKIKLKDISCPDVCKDKGGWSGEFS